MQYWTQKPGSQRTSKPVAVKIEANFAGQGVDFISFYDGKRYHCLRPENSKDVRELQSQAAILSHNTRYTHARR